VLSVASFALALLTHESSIVILPILALVEWAAAEPAAGTRGMLRACLPYAVLAAAYLAIDLPINQRSYLVNEGHYRFGLHAIRNVLGYIAWLYVGKRGWVSYGVISLVLCWLAVAGTRRARFGVFWMLVALLPFAFFTWGNTSRYLYLPGMGFALLLAEVVEWLNGALVPHLQERNRRALVWLVVAVLGVRFAVFASKGVTDFVEMAERYRRFLMAFRAEHPQVPAGSQISIDAKAEAALHLRYLQPMVQWEYRDPSITLVVREP
jgi:hypothetical protein